MKKNNLIKILIVEDEAVIAEKLRTALEDFGYEVLEPCLTPKEALDALQNEVIDLALLDINLSNDIDGVMLAKNITENFKIPFIFITANTDSATIERAAITKPKGFISKPVQMATLVGSIQVAIYNHQVNLQAKVVDATADYHFIKVGNKFVKIDWKSVTHIESAKNYAILHTNDGIKYPIRVSIESLLSQVTGINLVRIHKQTALNIFYIKNFDTKNVVLKNGLKLNVGNAYKDLLITKFNLFK
jgi:DNA-binding LytR/AlgR family response regulator